MHAQTLKIEVHIKSSCPHVHYVAHTGTQRVPSENYAHAGWGVLKL